MNLSNDADNGLIVIGGDDSVDAFNINFDNLYGNLEAGDMSIFIDNVAWSDGEDYTLGSLYTGNIANTGYTQGDEQNAIFSGNGNVFVYTDTDENGTNGPAMVFSSIDIRNLSGAFGIAFADNTGDDQDYSLVGSVEDDGIEFTTIYGFNGTTDSITFAGIDADGTNYEADATAGVEATTAGLWAELGTALDGTVEMAFGVFDEATANIDINNDGMKSSTLGVLAYDEDGTGITSLVFLDGVSALAEADVYLVV